MDSHLLILLIIVPTATALVDCRTACRTCREEKVLPMVLEVNCAMCQECKERRRERMLQRSGLGQDKTGTEVTTRSPTISLIPPQPSQFPEKPPERPELPAWPQYSEPYSNQRTPEDCPVQAPCSDSEEYIPPPPIKVLVLQTTKEPTTTTSTTTTTTTTTTRRPCPAIRPCKKKHRLSLPVPVPPPPPPPMPVPLQPAPMPGCCIPMQPMMQYAPYPYMGMPLAPGPLPYMPHGVGLAQGKGMHRDFMEKGFKDQGYKGSYSSQGYNKGQEASKSNGNNKYHKEDHENSGKNDFRNDWNMDGYGNNGKSSGSAEHHENGGGNGSGEHGIVILKTTLSGSNPKTLKKDFVYMYVGVPKTINRRRNF